jgi:hypothetical protein
MDKTELLELIRTERTYWESQLDRVAESQMTQQGVAGHWSVKDLIAHVTWSEREMVGLLRARALVGSELWYLSEDERNAAVYEENRQRPLADVLAEAKEVYQQFLELLETLSDEDLADPSRFEGMPPDWAPWQVLAGSSYRHYRDHAEDIRKWLEKTPST